MRWFPQGPNEKVPQGPQLQGHFERGDLLFSSQGRKVKKNSDSENHGRSEKANLNI